MQETFKPKFETLTQKEAAIVSGALTKKKVTGYKAPKTISGVAVYEACATAKVTSTAVITALASESSQDAVGAMEKITGKKVQMPPAAKAGGKSTGKSKTTAKKTGSGGGRSKYADDHRIIIHVAPNTKRGASHERFKIYKVGMTVAEAVAAGMFGQDIPWDTSRDLIKVAAPDDADAKKVRAEYEKSLPKIEEPKKVDEKA